MILMIYVTRKKKQLLPQATVSVGGLRPKSSLHNIAAVHDAVGKSTLANNSQNYIARYNTELSPSVDDSSEKKSQYFENRNVTPPTTHSPYPSYPNDSYINHQPITQMLEVDNVGRLNVFQPPKKRSIPLNLSTSKKQRTNKGHNIKDVMKENKSS